MSSGGVLRTQEGESWFCDRLANRIQKVGEDEEKLSKRRHINRDKLREDFYDWSGVNATSIRSILESREQVKVVILASVFYFLALCAYTMLANGLVFLTFRLVPEHSPSFAGHFSDFNRTRVMARYFDEDDLSYRRELFDLGFMVTPNRSDRPWWLKAAFVDTMVLISQFVGPLVLLSFGHTQNYVCYVCLIGFQGILKGITQAITILPSANKGQYCWLVNFTPEELTAVKTEPFVNWFYKSWGTGHGCDDMLWSGHTSQSCIGILFVNNTLRLMKVPRVFRFLLAVYFAVYVTAVLSCRMHYSIDVFVATIVASLMYTHSQLRYWIWWWANTLVCNPVSRSKHLHEPLPTHSEDSSGQA